MPYGLCIFDLDGTLTDPGPGITRSFQYALKAFGVEESLESLARHIGPPLRETFSKVYGFSASDTEKAVDKYREYYVATGLYENAVYPDIPPLLETLAGRGVKLAVATSKVTAYAQTILTHFKLAGYFAFISGDTMDGARTVDGKRGLILTAIGALDPLRKINALMIGDRMHDMEGARAAGIDAAGATWGYGSRKELENESATWIIDTADELLNIIIN